MLIPDTLRQEDMPMMVYYICKYVKSGEYKEEEVINRLTGFSYESDPKDPNPIRTVLKFARDSFISVDKSTGIYSTSFTDAELKDYSSFSAAVLKKLELNDENKFNKMLKWLVEDRRELSKYTTADDFLPAMNIKNINNANTIHGFLFWCEMLGIITFDGRKRGSVTYSLDSMLKSIIVSDNIFKQKGSMPAKEFFDVLEEHVYFVPMCIKNNIVSYPLSQAIRILEYSGVLKIENMQDSGDVWHLEQSNAFLAGNHFTNIKVC